VLKAEHKDLGYIVDVDKLTHENEGDNLKAVCNVICKLGQERDFIKIKTTLLELRDNKVC
jgi:hypothetical protein